MFAAPGQRHQLVARQRLARVLEQHLEHGKLAGGQGLQLTAAGQRAGGKVDFDVAEADCFALFVRRTGRAIALAAQHSLDTGEQFARIERLGQVVVGTHFEANDAVNLIRASLFAAAPDKRLGLFTEFSTREGIRLLPAEPEDKIEAMPDSRFFRLLQRELTARLGDHTRIAASVDEVSGFWVSFRLDDADDEEYWLVLPRDRAARDFASHWLLWGLLAVALARGREQGPFDRAIDVQVSRLRKLIESDPAQPRYLQTVWGFGYVFIPDGSSREA